MKRYISLIMLMLFVFMTGCDKASGNDTTTSYSGEEGSFDESVTANSDKTGDSDNFADNQNAKSTDQFGQVVTTDSNKADASSKTSAKPHHVITNPLIVTRTTNNKGNASDKFIKSLSGYEMTILYPYKAYDLKTDQGMSMSYVYQQVEHAYGVTITEQNIYTDYDEALTSSLAANALKAQVCMACDSSYNSYLKNGYMAELADGMETSGVDLSEPWYVDDANEVLRLNNKRYGWISSTDGEFAFPNCILFNSALFSKAKLTNPADLASLGKWTWNKLIEYSKALTKSNTVGFATTSATDMLSSMVEQKGVSLVNIGSSASSNIENKTVKDCLQELAEWCKDDKICNTYSATGSDSAKGQFAAGKIAMLYGGFDEIEYLMSVNKLNDELGVAPFPTPTAGKTYINVAAPQYISFIPQKYQSQTADILFLMNEVYRQKYRFSQRNFSYIFNESFDDDAIEECCNLKYAMNGNKTVLDWRSVYENADANVTTDTIVAYVIKGNTVEDAINKYKEDLERAY